MQDVLTDLTDADFTDTALVTAIEENGAAFLLALGRAAGADERHGKVHWVIGNSPIDYHNAVFGAELSEAEAEGVIAQSLARMRAWSVPGSWHVGPSMRLANLGERLLASGFAHDGDEVGMSIDLHALPEAAPVPAGFTLERVQDDAALAAWTQTLGSGFGEGPLEAVWVGKMYRRLGYGDEGPWQHYLGRLHGEPVATTSAFSAAGVVGFYFVFTTPKARRQGIGTAMILAPLLEAREKGYRIGVLNASAQGAPVYRRLGFLEHCMFSIYTWHPPQNT